MTKVSTLKAVREHSLFGPPPLLEGEDAAAYDELFRRVCAAVKPVDIIDEIYIADVVTLQWEILRWRRLKLSLIKASLHGPLQNFLTEALHYREYRQGFEQNLAEILQTRLSQEQAQELAHRCARSEQDAIKEVEIVLQAAGLTMNRILDQALADRAKDLTQEYGQGEPRAIKQVTKVLASSGRTMDDLIAIAVNDKVGYRGDHLTILERIDHLTTVAETRRNAMLREIDRRRAVLSEALRRQVQEVEGEFEVVEKTPAATKSAA